MKFYLLMGFKINFFFQNVLLDMTLSMKPIRSSASCRWYAYSGEAYFLSENLIFGLFMTNIQPRNLNIFLFLEIIWEKVNNLRQQQKRWMAKKKIFCHSVVCHGFIVQNKNICVLFHQWEGIPVLTLIFNP